MPVRETIRTHQRVTERADGSNHNEGMPSLIQIPESGIGEGDDGRLGHIRGPDWIASSDIDNHDPSTQRLLGLHSPVVAHNRKPSIVNKNLLGSIEGKIRRRADRTVIQGISTDTEVIRLRRRLN